ncbi:MAG: hypothetical protein LBK13_13160 [Spirochaetales bacterium]|jgi:hypothetical protein|nr:hypothetical protein [Spirochaetales bacterium]
MSDTELLIKEIQTLPTACVHEALEFIAALKQKRLQDMNTASSGLPGLDSYIAENSPHTIAEALQIAAARAADPSRKPISRHFGTLPGAFGNGVAYQRAMRDEWD